MRVISDLNECTNPSDGDWMQIEDVSAPSADRDRKVSVSRLALLAAQNSLPFILGPATSLVISNGSITVTGSYHLVDTEGATPTDDLTTINGGSNGQLLFLRTTNNARDVTLKTGTGNLLLGADIILGNISDVVILLCTGATWSKVVHGDN